jgi:hypothetical protein
MGGANFVTLGMVPDAANDGVQAAPINAAITGTATLIAAVAGKRIFVHGMFLTLSLGAPITLTFQDVSGSSTVNLTGPMTLGAGVPLDLPWQNYPWLACAVGDSLQAALPSGSVAQLSGRILYAQG